MKKFFTFKNFILILLIFLAIIAVIFFCLFCINENDSVLSTCLGVISSVISIILGIVSIVYSVYSTKQSTITFNSFKEQIKVLSELIQTINDQNNTLVEKVRNELSRLNLNGDNISNIKERHNITDEQINRTNMDGSFLDYK